MSRDVIITCAVTGGANTVGKHPAIPVTPEQIANAALESAQEGAAVVHCHVRDPQTGAASRDRALFREVVERIRDANSDVVINLTTGVGSDVVFGQSSPFDFDAGTDLVGPEDRVAHIVELQPDICSFDCGSMSVDDGNGVFVNTPGHLRVMAELIRGAGVRPELEVFDLGHIESAKRLIAEGRIDNPAFFQICLGVKGGAPAVPEAMLSMRGMLPAGAIWSAFGVGRMQFAMAAQSILLGGHVRVGLEDNLYLRPGVFASNGQLVRRAADIVESLGHRVMSAGDARDLLGLKRLH